jgi:hypothetical protein
MAGLDHEDWEEVVARGDVPDARVYTCVRCGQGTVVTGWHFLWLADPYRSCTETYCAGCNMLVPLNLVAWTETGESIHEYRARVRRFTPTWIGVLRSWLGILPGAVLGAQAGYLIGWWSGISWDRSLAAAFTGSIVGGFLGSVLLNRLVYALAGVEYRQMR